MAIRRNCFSDCTLTNTFILLVFLTFTSVLMLFSWAYNKNNNLWNNFDYVMLNSKLEMCIKPKVEITAKNQPRKVRVDTKTQFNLDNKIILLWTTFFGNDYSSDYYYFLEGNDTFEMHHCPYSDCIVTSNRSALNTSDAILFHETDFKPRDLPNYRGHNQKWIFYSLEPPFWIQNLKSRNDLFNWTMSYRSDSDVQVKYGEVCKLPLEEWESIDMDYLKNKSGEVVWFVSNCHSHNHRIDYVKILSKYIKVDIYGVCGTKTCQPSQSEICYQGILKHYKFYLSFENSNCKEYVTEKLFNILNYDIIPVVMGLADYESIIPPDSFISAMQFPNPADLAQFLKTVGQDSGLYNSYFRWKGKFKSYLYPWMCELCKKLHLDSEERTERNDVAKWWSEDAHCNKWEFDKFV